MHARRATAVMPEECPICLEPLHDVEAQDSDIVTLPCDHTFHAACIQKHVAYVCRHAAAPSPSCPCCRNRIAVVYVEAPLPMRDAEAAAAALCLQGCRACFYVVAGVVMVATLVLVGVLGERFSPK